MLSLLVGFVLKIASSGVLDKVLAHLRAEADSEVEREKVTAGVAIAEINAELARRQAQRDVLLAEQGWRVTAMMRPAFAYPLAVYYAAVIADSLFQFRWNVAALPPPIGDWSGWIISAIFLSESGERIARTIARQRGK
jgi:hypothetical protein